MGLLTTATTGQGKLTETLIKYHSYLCYLLYVAGIIWFLALAHEQVTLPTYFSENALLPGLVKNEFNTDYLTKQYLSELKHEQNTYLNGIPYPWILAKFHQLGLDAYTHSFQLTYTLGRERNFTGKNVYGILRAPRAASTEALILSAPYRPPTSTHPNTDVSIALMLSFAAYCKKQKYWAKDIIFLITEHEQLGTEAWLQAYMDINHDKSRLLRGELFGRAGSIQAAINIEMHDIKLGYIDVKIEGLNGQLPNLDLFNLANRLANKEGIPSTFKQRFSRKLKDPYRKWRYALDTLMAMVATQAIGVPTGNHGLYHRYGIQALTIEGHRGKDKTYDYETTLALGYLLEGIFRSLNNLLERFHQSFFLYLLTSSNRFISIAYYMPAVSTFVAALLIKALALWMTVQDRPYTIYEQIVDGKTASIKSASFSALKLQCIILSAYAFGFLLYAIPESLTKYGLTWKLSTDKSLYYGYAILCACQVCAVFMVRVRGRKPVVILQIFALLVFATILTAVSVYNFSIAFVIALMYTPLVLMIAPASRMRYAGRFVWFVAHPFFVVTFAVVTYTYVTFGNDDATVWANLGRGLHATQQAFVFAVVDWMVYGNLMFVQITLGFVPIWTCFWAVLFADVTGDDLTKKKVD